MKTAEIKALGSLLRRGFRAPGELPALRHEWVTPAGKPSQAAIQDAGRLLQDFAAALAADGKEWI